jgi:hypothetical protein
MADETPEPPSLRLFQRRGEERLERRVRLTRLERGAEGVHLGRHLSLQRLWIAAHEAPRREQSGPWLRDRVLPGNLDVLAHALSARIAS